MRALPKEKVERGIEAVFDVLDKRIGILLNISEKDEIKEHRDIDYLTKELSVFGKDRLFVKLEALKELLTGEDAESLEALIKTHRNLLLLCAEKALESVPYWSRTVLALTEDLINDKQIESFSLPFSLGKLRAKAILSWEKYSPEDALEMMKEEFFKNHSPSRFHYLSGLITGLSEEKSPYQLPASLIETIIRTFETSHEKGAPFYHREAIHYLKDQLPYFTSFNEKKEEILSFYNIDDDDEPSPSL